MAREQNAEAVDIKFMDLIGTWQHFTIPLSEFEEDIFEAGLGFDGSSIRGWQPINASDMLVMPDPSTAVMDPFLAVPTLSLLCTIVDPITKEDFSRDPRNIARKAEAYLKSTGVGDVAHFGPEPEFFIFDDIRFDQNQHEAYYHVDSIEGVWNSGRKEGPNLGYKPRYKEGYFPVPPIDSQQDIRTEMVQYMEKVGIRVERQHHEVATAGQAEIDMRFLPLVKMADALQWYKYIVKNVAWKHGKTATFMPKPIFGDNGSGMHVHQSIWKEGKPLFAGSGYADLSNMCLYYIGGIIKHAKALNAFTNSLTNSYKRLIPGFEAPVLLAYSARNRSASCRIPFAPGPKGKRVEVRFPDPGSNPYLAYAAMLMAGLDGIENKIHPGDPMDKDLYSLPPEELKDIPQVCGSLRDALSYLDAGRAFLKKGGVFTDDFIDSYIELKMGEVYAFEHTPHPVEFKMYYSV
jgi:glutamine synthetase